MSKANTPEGVLMKTLNLKEAAAFLQLHPVTLQRMAKRGDVPAAKLGKRWVFLEIDLVACLRAQYSSRVMQGEHERLNYVALQTQDSSVWWVKLHHSGKSYKEALGLPIR